MLGNEALNEVISKRIGKIVHFMMNMDFMG